MLNLNIVYELNAWLNRRRNIYNSLGIAFDRACKWN